MTRSARLPQQQRLKIRLHSTLQPTHPPVVAVFTYASNLHGWLMNVPRWQLNSGTFGLDRCGLPPLELIRNPQGPRVFNRVGTGRTEEAQTPGRLQVAQRLGGG
jgi:hypothetical protein